MKDRIYKHICLNYHTYSIVANLLIALGIAGLALLGVLTSTLAPVVLVGWGVVFACVYGAGKLLDQEVDDLDKVKAHSRRRCKDECDSNGGDGSSDSEPSV